MDILNQTVVQVLSTIILGFLGIVLIQAFTYLRSKTSLIKDENAKNIVDDTLDKLEKLINTNIVSIDATAKPIIIEGIKDGKLTKDELNTLAITVKKNVLDQMSDDSLALLNDTLKNVDSYIANKIEAQLSILKADPNSPVTKTEIK